MELLSPTFAHSPLWKVSAPGALGKERQAFIPQEQQHLLLVGNGFPNLPIFSKAEGNGERGINDTGRFTQQLPKVKKEETVEYSVHFSQIKRNVLFELCREYFF